MKKLLLVVLMVSLSFMLMGCYYGKSDYWESGYSLNEETKKKDDGQFLFSYKKGKVAFDQLEIKVKGETIFEKEDYKKREFSVPVECSKCITDKKTIKIDIKWEIKGKKYEDTVTLEKQ